MAEREAVDLAIYPRETQDRTAQAGKETSTDALSQVCFSNVEQS
jgi:hypothetical protein